MADSIDLIKIVSVGPQGPPGPGSVVSIATGTGLTGGPIVTSGTIALANTAVTAGSYTYSSLTVDAQGRLTAASSGTPVTSFSGGATGLSPVGATSGSVTLAGTLGLGYGGTGATSQQAAINALSGGVTSGYYLRGNGTNVVLSVIQAADIPTLNQNTTGTAGSLVNNVTFNNSGLGAISGTTFNGAASQTVSYNTLGASPLAGSTSLVTTGTVTTGTWSASFGAVSGANLTNLTAANLSGTISPTVLGNSSFYVGTTAIALNRTSANLALTGISSVALPGSTSGAVTLQSTAVADTTTITLPATTGTVITTGDTGTVTSTMILDGTILNEDINASAAIVDTKLATISTAGKVSNSATTAASANTASAIVARDGSGNFSAGTITAALTGAASSNVLKAGDTMTGPLLVPAGTAALPGLAVSGDPNTGIYNPSADNLAFSTGGTGRLFIDASGNVTFGVNGSTSIIAGQSITLARYSGTDLHSSWKTGNSSAGLGLYQTIGPASGGDSVERLRATISSASGSYQKGLAWQDDSGNLNLGFNAAQGRFEVGNTTIGAGTFTTAPASGTNIAGPNLIIAGGQSTGTGTGGSILFSTASAGGSGTSVNALIERLRIDSSGRLLVGTSTVSDNNAIVQISKDTSGGTGGSLVIRNGAGNAAGNMAELVFKTSSGFTDGYNAAKIAAIQPTGTAAGELAFYTYGAGTGTERLRITSAGNVGIGTSSPGSALEINAAASTSPFIAKINTAEAARIDSSGRLLVGTSAARTGVFYNGDANANPIFQIERSGNGAITASAGVGVIRNTDANAGGILLLARSAGTTNGSVTAVGVDAALGNLSYQGADGTDFVEAASISAFVDGTPGADDMPGRLVFSTTADGAATPTERMRITSAGKVGIGTTNVTQTLTVSNSTNYEGILINGNAAPSVCFDNAGNTAVKWRVGLSGSNNTTFCISQAGNTDKLAIDSAGRVLVGTSTANTSGAKLQTVDGITFPATQVASADPNTLDDYEEGTWTPGLLGSSTAGTATVGTIKGKYIKIGGYVTANFYIDWSVFSGTGDLRITGLPFTVSNDQNAGAVSSNIALPANTKGIISYAFNLQTYIVLNAYKDGANSANVQCANTGTVFGSVSYYI